MQYQLDAVTNHACSYCFITTRSYSDAMWNTYVTEAKQSGHHKQYCIEYNIPYTTFRKKHRQQQPITINNNTEAVNIDNSTTTDYNINIFKFVQTIIFEHTPDQPAALLLDSVGYQPNDRITQTCNNRNIAVYRIPPSTTAWLQPYDVLLFDSAKQMIRKQHKLDRLSDTPNTYMSSV